MLKYGLVFHNSWGNAVYWKTIKDASNDYQTFDFKIIFLRFNTYNRNCNIFF